ncbi:carbamoyltransferase C-terminal domain-containing protein [Actinoplanes sp. NPDC048988]|uniref:carbamoyltransferase C-terminal domain-containing protein n=1 Tax=Actinoplanes sp. NPDC048988 TaxID=3363901 RepID=UPI003721EFF9
MILGINYNGMHDSSVCLLDDDGTVVLAVDEERLSRVRQDGRFPYQALSLVDLTKVDAIGVPYLWQPPPLASSDDVFKELLLSGSRATPDPYPAGWHERLAALGPPLRFYDHHDMHAYTALASSGLPEALVLTSDYGAYACAVTTSVFHVRQGSIERLAAAAYGELEPLAAMYTDITVLLGFTPCRHEGKITGLAAHGKPSDACRRDVWRVHADIRADQHRLYDWVAFLDDDVPPFYEPNHHLVAAYRGQLPYSDADIARAAQDLLEEKVAAIIDWMADRFGVELPLLLSGGLFANVKANLLAARSRFPAVFVCPAMGDDGLSLGAAAAVHHERAGTRLKAAAGTAPLKIGPPLSMTLGPPATTDAAQDLTRFGLTFDRPGTSELIERVATTLAAGGTVAMVRGRQEFGPRALGHRSILADGSDRAILDTLNARLRRTEFMPFAPVLRDERLHDVFDLDDVNADVSGCLPFMTMCLPVRPPAAASIPAVVHVDGTARPQVLAAAEDPLLYRILQSYEGRTGRPALINTSFNVHDEPLVGSTADAVAAFFTARLDLLVIEDCLVEADANQQAAALVHAAARDGNRVARAQRAALNASFSRQMLDGPGRFSLNS